MGGGFTAHPSVMLPQNGRGQDGSEGWPAKSTVEFGVLDHGRFIIYLVDCGLAFSGSGMHVRPPGQRRCRYPPPQWRIGLPHTPDLLPWTWGVVTNEQ